MQRKGASREVLARARAASAAARKNKEGPQIDPEQAKIAAWVVPGCAPFLAGVP